MARLRSKCAHTTRAATRTSVAALAVACLPLCGADLSLGRRDPTLHLDTLAWQWENPGERPWRDEIIAELDPRGECALLVAGTDPRRLLLVAPGKEPVVVTRAYLELKPPVFQADGTCFFFSATYDEYSRDRTTYVRAGVFRADRRGAAARIYPPPGDSGSGAFGLLLDVAPGRDTALIGTGLDLEKLALPHGGFEVSVGELDLATGALRLFEVRINARAPAFYHRDGTGFFFHAEAPFGRLYPLSFFDFATHKARACPWNVESGGSPAGEVLAFRRTPRHLGSVREDDWPVFLVAKAARSPRARLELGGALAPLLGKDCVLRAVRGDFALFTSGTPGDETYSVAAFPRAARATVFAGEDGRDLRYTPLRLLWGDAPAATRALLLETRSRLNPPPLPRDASAAYVREALDPGVRFREEIAVHARADGPLLVRIAASGERGPRAASWGRDGAAAWFQGEGGLSDAPQGALEVIENSYSPYRSLFDPAGLLDPEIRFGEAGADGERIAIPFAYADGYRGTLRLDRKTRLPCEIETPVNFVVAVHAERLGAVSRARSMRLGAWRTEAGRLVPGEIVCHDGVTTFRVTLTGLVVDTGLPDELFRPPPAPAGNR